MACSINIRSQKLFREFQQLRHRIFTLLKVTFNNKKQKQLLIIKKKIFTFFFFFLLQRHSRKTKKVIRTVEQQFYIVATTFNRRHYFFWQRKNDMSSPKQPPVSDAKIPIIFSFIVGNDSVLYVVHILLIYCIYIHTLIYINSVY